MNFGNSQINDNIELAAVQAAVDFITSNDIMNFSDSLHTLIFSVLTVSSENYSGE